MNKKYQKYINYIVNDIQPPYFENMVHHYGLRPDEYELVLSKVYNQPVNVKSKVDYGNRNVYSVFNELGKKIYFEDDKGEWVTREYDERGNLTYYKKSNGKWHKYEYNEQGHQICFENSDGFWERYEYNDQGKKTYYRNIEREWEKWEYDDQGKLMIYKNSEGNIDDRR